jgi:Zn-dependent peptidase ImmA (M78 family)
MSQGIGDRVRALLPADHSQREIASGVGMTPDAFSRALNGQRGFSAIELARIAERFGTDVHQLITGEPDPLRLRMAARHDYDPRSGQRDVPGALADRAILDDVALAYRQVVGAPLPPSRLAASAAETRVALGDGFVRPFVSRLEALDVDVVRLPVLSTSYCFTLSGRGVIVVPASGNWYRENWSLAHELAHLVLGHADPGLAYHEHDSHEVAANAFAAELLLPADEMATKEWTDLTPAGLASCIWEWGVSTKALFTRMKSLKIPEPLVVAEWADQPTLRLLRRHWQPNESGDPITERMDGAATRRFPLALQDAHLSRIAEGALPKATLAWMLGVDENRLEVDEPLSQPPLAPAALADMLGL